MENQLNRCNARTITFFSDEYPHHVPPGGRCTGAPISERRLCDILTREPLHIDALSRELSLSPAEALATLLNLEMKGVVKQIDGKRFYLVP